MTNPSAYHKGNLGNLAKRRLQEQCWAGGDLGIVATFGIARSHDARGPKIVYLLCFLVHFFEILNV